MTDDEINEAVARKLGWKVNKPPYKLGKPRQGDKWIVADGVPDYAGSISAAWEIVEKERFALIPLWKSGKWWCGKEDLRENEGNELWIDLRDHFNGAVANTPQLAICLAFLKLKQES